MLVRRIETAEAWEVAIKGRLADKDQELLELTAELERAEGGRQAPQQQADGRSEPPGGLR